MTTGQFGQPNSIFGKGVPATVAPLGVRYYDTTNTAGYIEYISSGSAWVRVGGGAETQGNVTYANLSASAAVGDRAYVSDGNVALAFGTTTAGGGTNSGPVYFIGSSTWKWG